MGVSRAGEVRQPLGGQVLTAGVALGALGLGGVQKPAGAGSLGLDLGADESVLVHDPEPAVCDEMWFSRRGPSAIRLRAMSSSWEETKLWAAICQRTDASDAAVAAATSKAMTLLHTVVASADDPEGALTWHDPSHALQVAELISEIVSDEGLERLAAHELSLLLLGAYAHDVGQTPQVARSSAHYAHLLSGQGDLSGPEKDELQRWLDREERGVQPPIRGRDDADAERRARLLTARYANDRHIETGARWLREQILDVFRSDDVAELGEDLLCLCASHRAGYSALVAPELDPRFLRRGRVIIHRRYLACVLRVADVLDFDPERTPTVLTSQRGMTLRDALRWRRQPHTTLEVAADGRVLAEARPSSALHLRVLNEVVDAIEAELRLVHDVDAGAPFRRAPRRTRPLPHQWRLEPVVYRDIRPHDDRFVYIDGAFRPNTTKLLELLGGQDLYGTEAVAIRELVQNAYDAVRERIAWQRLLDPAPLDDATIDRLRRLHQVTLQIARRDDGHLWLICRDTGGGMSREIITNYLLVSGSSRPPEVYNLQRRARAAGFELQRSGRFGIGVLSYFMLADRVEIRTRRCLEAPMSDGGAWAFSTNGVGSFGELRRDPDWRDGTEIALRLRAPHALPVDAYLKHFICRTPCNTTLIASGGGAVTFPAGWVVTTEALTTQFVEPFADRGLDRTPEHLRGKRWESRVAIGRNLTRVVDDIQERIRWSVTSGITTSGAASFRLCVPYFDLEGGRALSYMKIERRGSEFWVHGVGNGEFLLPRFHPSTSHDGLALALPERDDARSWHRRHDAFDEQAYFLETDWHSDVVHTSTVRRNAITDNATVTEARKEIQEIVRATLSELVESAGNSPYARLNRKRIRRRGMLTEPHPSRLPGETAWAVATDDAGPTAVEWATIDGMAVDAMTPTALRLRGKNVRRLYQPAHRAAGLVAPETWWFSDEFPAEMCIGPAGKRFVQVFDLVNQERRLTDDLGTARFPTGAGKLLMIRDRRGPIFNREHALVQQVQTPTRVEWSERIDTRMPLDDQVARLADDPTEIASWFCAVVLPGQLMPMGRRRPDANAYWAALVEASPPLAGRVFQLAGAPQIHVFDQSRPSDDPTLWSYTSEGSTSRTVTSIMSIDGVWRLDPSDRLEAR
jgi:hypothetical protein